jgi:hypothetical protein
MGMVADDDFTPLNCDWSMELPGPVDRFHRVGDQLVVVLKDGRAIDLSNMSADAKPNA